MAPKVGDELLSHRHFYTSKSLQPLSALVSYETDEEPYRVNGITVSTLSRDWNKATSFRTNPCLCAVMLIILMLSGCASQSSFMVAGMSKKEFLDKSSFWEVNISKIYYDPASRIEVFAPDPLYWSPNNSGLVTVAENVSVEWNSLWKYCGQMPKGTCRQVGDGQIRSWYTESQIEELALLGDEEAILLLSVLTLRQEEFENNINTIMNEGIEWVWDIAVRRGEKESYDPKINPITRKQAIKIYKSYKFNQTSIQQRELASRMLAKFKNSPFHTCVRDADGYPTCRHKTEQNVKSFSNVRTESMRETKPKSVLSSNNFFESLIEQAIGLYVQKALGIKPSYDGPSEDDLRKIEEASRRGMRKALRKQKRMDNVYKNIKTPPPIR